MTNGKHTNQKIQIKEFYFYARNYPNLKDGFIVRYADDFKIMCRTYDEAQRWYYATVDFLKNKVEARCQPREIQSNQYEEKLVNIFRIQD